MLEVIWFSDTAAISPTAIAEHIDLEAFVPHLPHRRIRKAVDVAFFHAVVVNNHEQADAKAHELLDDRASGAGCTNDSDPKRQALYRDFVECLDLPSA